MRHRFAARLSATLFATVIASLLFAACPDGGGGGNDDDAATIPSSLWGRWSAIAAGGDELYFSATGLRVGAGAEIAARSAAAGLVVLSNGSSASLVSDNVLGYASASYLRKASPSGTLKGMVFDQSKLSGSRALSSGVAGLSGLSLVLINALNNAQKITAETGALGELQVTSGEAIPGDQYLLALPGGDTVTLTTLEPDGDVGVASTTDQPYNLKLSYAMTEDLPRAYALGSSQVGGAFVVTVKNEGSATSPAGTWEYDLDEAGSLGFNAQNLDYSMPSIQPGGIYRIPAFDEIATDNGSIPISHPAIDTDFVDVRVIFRFRPTGGKIWEDYASLRVYKRPVMLWLYSTAAIDALVVLPGENLAQRMTAKYNDELKLYRNYLEVPYRSDRRYLITLSGSADAAYALGLDLAGISNPATLLEGAPSQPGTNISEASALDIQYGQTITGRLGAAPAFFRSDPTTVPTSPAVAASPKGGTSIEALVCSFSPLIITLTAPNVSGIPDPNAIIHYSTNDSDPTAASPSEQCRASFPLALTESATSVRAYAAKTDYQDSPTASWYYRLDPSGVPASPILGPWTESSADTVMGHGLLAIGGKRYRIGGGEGMSDADGLMTEFYFPGGGSIGSWNFMEYLPSPRTRQAAAWLSLGEATAKNYIYIIGGYNDSQSPQYRDEVFAYNQTNRVWLAAQPDLPWAAEGLDACALNGRVYVAGGDFGSTYLANFASASPAADTGAISIWTSGPALNAARTTFRLVAIESSTTPGSGWIYAIGGTGSGGILASVERISVAVDGTVGAAWDTSSNIPAIALPALPIPLAEFACAASDSRIFVIGGTETGSGASDKVYYADVDTATGALGPWIEDRPLKPGRRYAAAVVVGGKLVVSGGRSGIGTLSENEFTWGDMLEATIAP